MKKWALETCCTLLIIAGAMVLVAASSTISNCRGNSECLSVSRNFHTSAYVEALRHKSEEFDGLRAASGGAQAVDFYFGLSNQSDNYLVRRTFSIAEDAPRHIIIISTVVHDNVPQPTIWNGYRRNPAHAVGCSDGTSGLITPAEFAALNVSGFVRADMLFSNSPAPNLP